MTDLQSCACVEGLLLLTQCCFTPSEDVAFFPF